MPELKGFRVLNLAYGETFVIPDLTLDFFGRNTLILMPNGTGKTYLLSCFFQTVLPGAHTPSRSVEDLFSRCTGTSHILTAFSIEKETVFLGFCTRKKTDRTYFNWTLRLDEPCDIDALPMRRGESVLDYDELPLLLKSLHKDRFTLFRREAWAAYEQQLERYGLGTEEWRLMRAFNLFLEGALPVQEVLPGASDRLLDPMVFPLIEKRLKMDGFDPRERVDTFFSSQNAIKPSATAGSVLALKERLQSRLSTLDDFREAKEELNNAVYSLRTIQEFTHKEIRKAKAELHRLGARLVALGEEEAQCDRNRQMRALQESVEKRAELERTEARLVGLIEEKQQKIALLYETLRRRLTSEPDPHDSDWHTDTSLESRKPVSVPWALMAKHHLESLLETVKAHQTERESALRSSWEILSIQQRCVALQERYERLGGLTRFQKIGYEKERARAALERNRRRQSIQKVLRIKLRQKHRTLEGDLERLKAQLAEVDRNAEGIQNYREFAQALTVLEGARPLPLLAERLVEKRNRMCVRIAEERGEIERLDRLDAKEAEPIGARPPKEVEKLSAALERNGFSGFEKGADWIGSGKSDNPFLSFSLITEYPLEMDQALSRLPFEDFPTFPIPVLSVREATNLAEASEYRTMMRLKLRWVPSLTERALQLRLSPGMRAFAEKGPVVGSDLAHWLQARRASIRARIENLEGTLKKTERQLERLAYFIQAVGSDPEVARETLAEKRSLIEKDLWRVSKSLGDLGEKIRASRLLSTSLDEEERALQQKIETLEREEWEWSQLSSEIDQACQVPLKDFSLFCLSIQKRLAEWDAKVQEAERVIGESLEELRNPWLSLVAREGQAALTTVEEQPEALWEIVARIRSLESELRELLQERAVLQARSPALLDSSLSPNLSRAIERGSQEDPLSQTTETLETLGRRLREIEKERQEIAQETAEIVETLQRLETLAQRQRIFLAGRESSEKKYISGLPQVFLKSDLHGLWTEKEAVCLKQLYALDRQQAALDEDWADLKKALDPTESWEEPVLDSPGEEELEGGKTVVTRLLHGLKRRIDAERAEERRAQSALSCFSREIGDAMEVVNAHLREIARFSKPELERAPLLEFSLPNKTREEYDKSFSSRLAEYIALQRIRGQEIRLQWPLRTLWEFYHDERLEIRIEKPPFTREGEGKHAWKEVEKWSTGEKMAVYLALYASLFAWWKGQTPNTKPTSFLILDNLFGHINTETLLEIPMRMLYTHKFQIIGFTSSAEPFLFKYFPKWIGLSPQETDHYSFFLPFHVER